MGSWIPDTPKNQSQRKLNARERKEADLQCEEAVVDLDLLGEEIGADGGLVLVAELVVDVPARASTGTRITPPNEGNNNLPPKNLVVKSIKGRDKAKLTGSSARSCRPCQEARGVERGSEKRRREKKFKKKRGRD